MDSHGFTITLTGKDPVPGITGITCAAAHGDFDDSPPESTINRLQLGIHEGNPGHDDV